MIKHALIVDDEPDIRKLLEITLSRLQLKPIAAVSIADALNILTTQSIELCLTDMRLPDSNGIELVTHIQEDHPNMPAAIITAHGSMNTAITALKAGVFDFVSKPLDLKILLRLVAGVLRLFGKEKEPDSTKLAVQNSRLIGDSVEMQKLNVTIHKLACSQAPVYIRGESGVGKELVAKEIHMQGPRCDQAFIPVNCAAIPSELMEIEFFGYIRDSFTGTTNDKQGETLFLDEIAELPLHMQVKLLRAIQERAIKPIGKQEEIGVDVRILSTTHKDLTQEVEQESFRQDLFYRISVIELPVPPLRDRTTDIAPLTNFILEKIANNYSLDNVTIDESALAKLTNYSFPGNIRELENIAANDIFLPDISTMPDITDDVTEEDSNDSSIALASDQLEEYLEDKEKQAITSALEKTRWNKTVTAKPF